MLALLIALIVGLMMNSAVTHAQTAVIAGATVTSSSSPPIRSLLDEASSPKPDRRDSDDNPLNGLVERWRPLQARVVGDDRLRAVSGVIGLGLLAYEGLGGSRRPPLQFIGTEALRMGLHSHLTDIKERTGFSVEPSINRGGFAVTFRKTFE